MVLSSFVWFLQYLVPEEHDLTFSWLNTNVIQVGVMFLLVTDATGPIYGWAQYIFSSESGLCILDAGSRHVTTYISVSLPLYYFLPFIVTLVSHALVLFQRHSYHEEDEYPSPSRVIPSGRRGQLLLFLSCLLPFLGRFPSVLAVVMCAALFNSDQAQQDTVDDTLNKICREGHLEFELVWLKFFSITCLPPIMLLLGCSSLRRQARKSIFRVLRRCRRRPRDNPEVSIELRTRTNYRYNRRLNPNPCILPPPRDPMCSRDIRRVRTRSPEDEIIELV